MFKWVRNNIPLAVGVVLIASTLFGGANYSRIKTWITGETLTASDLNAEFNNILNNHTPAGMDDYSANATEMRSVADPYPAAAESLATSLQGELERIRYQILEIKKAFQASDISYWYQDLPTAGVFTIAGSSVSINDTTPDFGFDFGTTPTIGVDGDITTSGDDVDITTHVVITGNLTVSGTLTAGGTRIYASTDTFSWAEGESTAVVYGSESLDANSEFNGSTFTVTTTGQYDVCANGRISVGGFNINAGRLQIIKNNGSSPADILAVDGVFTNTTDIFSVAYYSACIMTNLTAGDKIWTNAYCNNAAGGVTCTLTNGIFSVSAVK